jgi:CRISPR-associated endonuclease/helicase Cas3
MHLDFSCWYEDKHGYQPFPWQRRLAGYAASGHWPDMIAVPTGAGKTGIIAVWHWLHESGEDAPTRLIYVIDRRLIVDSATDYAERIGAHVIKMRGGITVDNSWLMEPNKPTVIVSTVDQVGSRLLWRGYGVSPNAVPIHAALVGNDALIVLDEAHLSTPFASTLNDVARLRGAGGRPWRVVLMTATPKDRTSCLLPDEEDLRHPLLVRRLNNNKRATLAKASPESFVTQVAGKARSLRRSGNDVVGIVVNTTKDAQEVFAALDGEKILLTGRVRPYDKDRILADALPRMECGSRNRREALYIVATQTIEVGADLDFDALVTQSAPMDALRQRFGRLDRLGELGESSAVVVHKDLGKDEDCPIYGKQLLKETWQWLNKHQQGKGKDKHVDFGPAAMDATLAMDPPPERDVEPVRELTEADLLVLRQTQPMPVIDVSPWLHGERTQLATVSVVWRADLDVLERQEWVPAVQASYPVVSEACPIPLYAARSWLQKRPAVVADRVVSGMALRPGDMVVVPTHYGGYGPWGWDESSTESVADIGNVAGARVRLMGADENTEIGAELERLGLKIENPVATPYPGGLVVSPSNRRARARAVKLRDHLREIVSVAHELSDNPVVIEAAQLHDIGKQDARFQVMLGAREELLAKSGHASPYMASQAWAWSGLPAGWRHEVASLTMLPDAASDLLKYLVATHHGYGRTILPVGGDIDLWYRAGGSRWGKMTDALNAAHGAWGLAYLEALVRLADWIQSRREQEYV